MARSLAAVSGDLQEIEELGTRTWEIKCLLATAVVKSGRRTETVSLLMTVQVTKGCEIPFGESMWRGGPPLCAFGVLKSPVTGSNAWRAPSAALVA